MWPKIVLNRVPAQIDKQLVDETGGESFLQAVQEIPGRDWRGRSRTTDEGRRRMRSRPVSCPHSRSLRNISSTNIFRPAFDQVGVWQMPQGGGLLCLSRATAHDDGSDAATNSRKRLERSRANQRRDGKDRDEGRVQGNDAGVFHETAHRSAVLLQDPGGIVGSIPGAGEADRSQPGQSFQDPAANSLWRDADSGQDRSGYNHGLLQPAGGRRITRRHSISSISTSRRRARNGK